MNSQLFYPIVKISEKILKAKNSFIPQIDLPEVPQKPVLKKYNYFGYVCFISLLIIAIFYKLVYNNEIACISIIILVFLIISIIWFLHAFITNKLKYSVNQSALANYEVLKSKYENGLKKNEEIEIKNKDEFLLSQHRKNQMRNAVLTSRRNLKAFVIERTKVLDDFYQILILHFPDNVLINYTIDQFNAQNQFLTKFIVIEPKSKLHIDIEIDVPYDLETKIPIDYIDEVTENTIHSNHDNFFTNSGWIVVRFAEEQIVKYPESCCKFIAQQFFEILEINDFLPKYNIVDELPVVETWSQQKATELAKENYRESYLSTEKTMQTDEILIEDSISNDEIMIEETFTQNEINTEESDKNENTVIDDFIKKEEVIEKSLNAIIILNKLKKEKKISDVNETPDLKYESTKSETVLNTEKNEDKVITAIETENKNELIEKNIIEDKSLNFIDKVIEHISEIEQRKNSSKNLTDNTIQKTNENEIVDSDENSNSEIKDGDKEIISQNENIETEETIENELEMGLIKLISRMHDYYYVEEWNKLILITDKIIEIEPKFELAYIKRSSAKGNLGDYDGSIADCKKIISLNPCNAEAYYNAGLAYYFTENYDDAIEFLQNAIKNNISDLDKVYLIIAKSYSKKNNLINEYEYLNKSSQLGNTTAKDLLFKLKRKQIIDLHEYTEGYVIKTIKTDKNGCSDICFNLNNDLAAVTGFGNSIKIYKTRNWEVVFELNSPASSVSFSKDGLYLAVCGYNSIQIWDITTKEFQKIRHLETIQGDLKKVFFDYENKNVITTDNSTLYSFNIKSSQFEKKITDFHYFAKTKDSLYIVGTDYFKSIIIYRTSDFSIFAKIKFDFETDIKSISINNDVRKLVVGDSNGNFYIYLIKTGKVLVKVKTNENNAISSINFDPNGKYILTCAGTKTVNFWDSSNGNLIKSIKTKFIPKFSVLSNNGYYLAMGGFTDSVDFWYIKKDELN